MTTVLLLTLLSQSPILHGRVVGVHDGDTVTLLTESKEQVKIRLAEIDAPELKQKFGPDAKKALSNLVFGKEVSVDVVTRDRYGRTVGRIWVDDQDVNFAMVAEGDAWCYRQYLKRKDVCLRLESVAKTEKRGLWSDAAPTAPWEYRHHKKMAETL